MEIVVNEKGIITPQKDPGQRLVPLLFSFLALLLIVTGGISVITLQNTLKQNQESRNQAAVETPTVTADHCMIAGCSGELCVDPTSGNLIRANDGATAAPQNCENQSTNICYKNVVCRIQADGHCGWTQTSALQECLSREDATLFSSKTEVASRSATSR